MLTMALGMPERTSPQAPPPGALSLQFHAIFSAEFEFVCRTLRRLGVREADLQDVAQELFVTVHGHLHEFQQGRPLRPWLVGFAVRFAANYRKLARNRYEELESGSSLEQPSSPSHETRDLLYRALDTLDFDRRTAIVMHDFEGLNANEIAEALGIPINTVYSRIRLGREAFRASVVGTLQGKGLT